MAYPTDRKYSTEHEWLLINGDEATVGITDYAQEALGSVVFVDLPAEGDAYSAGDTFGEVESVKSVSELFLPVTGEVTAVNNELASSPETINEDPYGAGWLVRVRVSDPGELDALLDASAYEAIL